MGSDGLSRYIISIQYHKVTGIEEEIKKRELGLRGK